MDNGDFGKWVKCMCGGPVWFRDRSVMEAVCTECGEVVGRPVEQKKLRVSM